MATKPFNYQTYILIKMEKKEFQVFISIITINNYLFLL